MEMRNRVLIVEDDHACETILKQIIHSVDPDARVDWVDSGEAAALTLVQERAKGVPYNLVIADVFLNGKLTGVDLWRLYQEYYPAPPVVLTSSLPIPRFLEKVGSGPDVPVYLPKPFYAEECRQIVKRYMASV
ncbi:MAG: response regulator [Bdellovibrionota bacterium]